MTVLGRFVIAVVDDDSQVLESLENLLLSAGGNVRLFSSAEAFLEGKTMDEVDCVISDIGMPGMSGLDLLATVQTRRPDLPVILITGRSGAETSASCLAKGARYFFRKPFHGPELLTALHTLLAGK